MRRSLSVLLVCLFLSGCESREEKTYKFGYLPIIGDLPVMVAADKGFFKREGLKVELVEFGSGNDAMNAILTGRIIGEATIGYSTLFAVEAKTPGSCKVILSVFESDSAYGASLVARNGSGIRSIPDLAGKKVGTYSGPTHQWTLDLILQRFPGIAGQVETIQVEPKLQLQALESGVFDALLSIEPYPTLAVSKGIAYIAVPNVRSEFITRPFWAAGTVISSEFVVTEPKTARRVVQALDAAVRYIRENEREARLVALKYTPLDSVTVAAVRLYDWIELGNEDLVPIQKLSDAFYAGKLMERPVDVRAFFDWDLANDAQTVK